MAKNKVEVDVKIDDKGTIKKVALESKKAGDNIDSVARSSRTADRNLKGAAQSSSSATKNFSKLSQGMGGLVGAYATFAATMFAVSAVFQLFKSAGEMGDLQRGQQAYAASTGIAIKSLSSSIVEATNSQIDFKEASQAAAIGLSSGLNPKQLRELGSAARDLSAILGRDVGDSFQRLIRGATKAEPELLDELGIILRLDDAFERYERATGRAAEGLNSFERTQAVTNEILRQSQEKYSSMIGESESLGNAAIKLGASLQNDIIKPMLSLIDVVGTPIFEFLANNVKVFAAALTILLVPLFKSMAGLSFQNSEAAKEAAKKAGETATIQKKAHADMVKDVEAKQKKLQKTYQTSQQAAAEALGGTTSRKGSHAQILKDGKDLSDKQVTAMRINAEKEKGIYGSMEAGKRDILVRNLKVMEAQTKSTTSRMSLSFQSIALKVKTVGSSMRVTWAATMGSMAAASATFAVIANGALSMVAWIGLIVTAAYALYEAFKFVKDWFSKTFFPQEYAAQQLAKKRTEQTEEAIKVQKRLNDEIDEMHAKQAAAPNMGGFGAVARAGNTFGSIDAENIFKLQESVKNGGKAGAEAKKQLDETANRIKTTIALSNGAFGSLADGVASASTQTILDLLPTLNQATSLVNKSTQSAKNASTAFNDVIKGFLTKGTYDSQIKALEDSVKDYEAIEASVRNQDQDSKKINDRNVSNLKILKQLATVESTNSKNKLATEEKFAALRHTITGDALTLISGEQAIAKLSDKIANEKAKQAAIESIQKANGGELAEQQRLILEGHGLEIKALNKQVGRQRELNKLKSEQLGQKRGNQIFALTGEVALLKSKQVLETDVEKQARESNKRQLDHDVALLPLAQELVRKKSEILEHQKNLVLATSNTMIAAKEEERILGLQIERLSEKLRISEEEAALSAKRKVITDNELLATTKLDITAAKLSRGRSASVKEDISNQVKLSKLFVKKKSLEQQLNNLAADKKPQHRAQIAFLEQQILLQKDLMDDAVQYAILIRDSIQSNLASGIADLIKGSETSLKRALVKMTRGVLNTIADKIANDMANAIMGAFGFNDPIITSHTAGGILVAKSITDAFAESITKFNSIDCGCAGGSMPPIALAAAAAKPLQDISKPDFDFAPRPTSRRPLKLSDVSDRGSRIRNDRADDDDLGMGNIVVGNQFNNAKRQQSIRDAMDAPFKESGGGGLKGIFTTFTGNMKNLFDSNGEGTFLSKLGKIFTDGGKGFKDVFGSLFSGLKSLLMGGGGMGGGSFLDSALAIGSSFLGFKNGGMSPKMGYADGGVARGPNSGYAATLHGNEAIVPLPNNRSIPVDLKGASNTSNNITVNIATDGSTTTKQQDGGPDMQNLGKAVAKAVQQELHNQRRSGGILNPYGAT